MGGKSAEQETQYDDADKDTDDDSIVLNERQFWQAARHSVKCCEEEQIG